jgi:myo-inositol 2-dehydrogenase/D-chiro-inositol 1-dehydrogenase/scyllo-inositol 2-dehydrogenase (NAD+)
VRLAAVCDANEEAAQGVASSLEGVKAYGQYERLLEAEKPDCVLVVTPTFTHSEIAVAAAEAGAHIFCEKPMAISLEECDRMLEATRRNGVKLMLGFVRRFQPSYQEMKRRVDAGLIGPVRLVQSLRMGGRPPVGVGSWRLERRKVGGLHSAYIHEMDQLLWLAGPVRSVRAVTNAGTFPDTDVEDSIWMCLEFGSGAVGALGSSQVYGVGSYELGVGGTRGSMKISSGTTAFQYRPHGGPSEIVELPAADAFTAEIHHFFEAVRRDETPAITGEDGRRSLEVVLAAFRSAATGETVTLTQ